MNLALPNFGFTKPLVTPRLLTATVSPFTTRRRVNSEDRVCMTIGRSLSLTCRSKIGGMQRSLRSHSKKDAADSLTP